MISLSPLSVGWILFSTPNGKANLLSNVYSLRNLIKETQLGCLADKIVTEIPFWALSGESPFNAQ